MPAEVETMFYTRETPWHGLGVKVEDAPTSLDAIVAAGLDWKVEPKSLFTADGVVDGWRANVRSSDKSVLGIVSGRYQIMQNEDAFAFTDYLIGTSDVRYETAGSLLGGKKVWLLAKMPEVKILGDKVDPYLCFVNTFDGSGAVRVCMTPVRVVCQNTLNAALAGASKSWSIKHIGNIKAKIAEARDTLGFAERYMKQLGVEADRWANTTITTTAYERLMDRIFPIREDDGNRKQHNMIAARERFLQAYEAEDIQKFKGTAWGVINAAADFMHYAPLRQTKNYKANLFNRTITTPFIDEVIKQMAA